MIMYKYCSYRIQYGSKKEAKGSVAWNKLICHFGHVESERTITDQRKDTQQVAGNKGQEVERTCLSRRYRKYRCPLNMDRW